METVLIIMLDVGGERDDKDDGDGDDDDLLASTVCGQWKHSHEETHSSNTATSEIFQRTLNNIYTRYIEQNNTN